MVKDQSISDIEKTISEIEGVEAARIVANGHGIEEIHVLSSPSKNIKSVAKGIESALMIKHSVAVDHRKISIAQVSNQEDKVVEVSRLKLKAVSIETTGLVCRISVSLLYNEKDFEGVAQGPCSSFSKQRLVGEATLKALEKSCLNKAAFALEALELVNLGNWSVVCACITLLSQDRESVFIGSSLQSPGYENEAIVKAILSAINRRFNLL